MVSTIMGTRSVLLLLHFIFPLMMTSTPISLPCDRLHVYPYGCPCRIIRNTNTSTRAPLRSEIHLNYLEELPCLSRIRHMQRRGTARLGRRTRARRRATPDQPQRPASTARSAERSVVVQDFVVQ